MITGWPTDVLQGLKRVVRRVTNLDEVSEFYIGRTAHPTQTRSRHGADELLRIYRTRSVDHSEEVEQVLLDTFYDHRKCSNDSPHSGGGVSEASLHYVYVAVWER